MPDKEKIEELWWSGVRLWYNEQDFLEAMQEWQRAVDVVDWEDEGEDRVIPKKHSIPGEGSFLAPIMLFLAGCHLDAGESSLAQRLCRRCFMTSYFWSSLAGKSSDDFAHCLLSEYAATFQEDQNILRPWDMAYKVTQWAIQERQKHSLNANLLSNIWSNPYQRPGFFYPSLSSQPIYIREQHPEWCRKLEEHYPVIRGEYEQLLFRGRKGASNHDSPNTPEHWPCVGAGGHRDGAGAHDASVVQGGDWREIILFGSGARPDLAPRTSRILQQFASGAVDLAQEGAGEIIFSVLAANTHIAPHCGSTNIRLTAHLGLQVPKDCYIQVADDKLNWEQGKVIVFDDSFQHEVHNNSKEIRAVLLLRFWHPQLSATERQEALKHVYDAKETDRLRRCNPPMPPNGTRNARGMNQSVCPYCGRSGFEAVRLVRPEGHIFSCICGKGVDSETTPK